MKNLDLLRYVSVILKVFAVLFLIAGIVVLVISSSLDVGDLGDLSGPLRGIATFGGVLGLIGGLFYAVLLWGLADLMRLQQVTEQNTREALRSLTELKEQLSTD